MTASTSSRVPVLFLGGYGRSGSTLLERMVAELPGTCSLGEVVHLWERALRDDERCGCGLAFSACAFWRDVGDRAFGGWHTLDAGAVLALKHRVDRNRFIPRLLLPLMRGSAEADLYRYIALYESVYAAALEVSGARVVVDSSKHASLAFCLRRAKRLRLRVVHMVRDSPGVAYSWGKAVRRPEAVAEESWMPQYGVGRAAGEWLAYNLLFELLRMLRTPTLLVRYEDVVADPRAALRAVAAHGGLAADDEATSFVDGSNVTLSTTHTVAGNPMRFTTGTIAIRRDDAWRTALPARSRRTILAITAPLRLRFGYAGRRSNGPAARTESTA